MATDKSPPAASGGTIAKRIRSRVDRRNNELRNDALLSAGMGLVTIFFVYGLLFALAWLIGLFIFFNSTTLFATAVTSLFFVVAVWSAWRGVDPAANLEPPDPKHPTVEWIEDFLSEITDTPRYKPRFAIAGAGMLFLSGPQSLFEAWGAWRARLPNGDEVIESAATLLQRCRKGAMLKDIDAPRAAILLRQLMLIRVVEVGDSPRLELTERGIKLLDKPRKARRSHPAGRE